MIRNDTDVVQVTVSRAAVKTLYRLESLKAEGVYELLLLVRGGGGRELVVKNAGQPHPIEIVGRGAKRR